MLQKVIDAVKGREVDNGPLFTMADNQSTRRAKAWLAAQIKRGKQEVFGVPAELTPELAELLLASNPNNRTMSPHAVKSYARDIEDGAWDMNGQPIIVASDGSTNDGQHRCAAVVATGRSIPCMFIFGVERGTRTTLDGGRARQVGDYLQMDGHANSKQVASIARLVWQYDVIGRMSTSADDQPTKRQTLEFALENPALSDSAIFCQRGYQAVIGSLATLGACHFIFARLSKSMANDFVTSLMDGVDLTKNTALHTLRERLLSEKTAKHRIPPPTAASIIILGWNAHRQGRHIQRINNKGVFPRAI